MMRYPLLRCLAVATITGTTTAGAQDSVVTSAVTSRVEDIYVAHAVRRSRIRPTVECSEGRVGFDRIRFEDRFALRSIETRPSDGRIVRTDVDSIGDMHVCFGLTALRSTFMRKLVP